MTGVIIAAGRGGRLSNVTGGMPKTLLLVNGKPIIQWIIDESYASGIKEFLVVTGYNSEKIRDYFNKNPRDNLTFIYNPLWERGNGISVLSVEKMIDRSKEFVLMMSDHLIEGGVINAIIKERRCPLLAVEKNIDKVFDIMDATKVYIDNKRVISIGKDLKRFNGVDAGLFLLNDSIFHFLKKSIKKGEDSLTAGIQEMIKRHKLYTYSIPNEVYWIDVDSKESYNNAIQMWRRR